MSITAGQIVSVIQGLGQIGVDTSAATSLNLSSLASDAVVGEDVLTVVAIFWPPAALLVDALVIAVALAPLLPALNIRPDPLPMTDAQTTQSRGGRNE